MTSSNLLVRMSTNVEPRARRWPVARNAREVSSSRARVTKLPCVSSFSFACSSNLVTVSTVRLLLSPPQHPQQLPPPPPGPPPPEPPDTLPGVPLPGPSN